MIVGSDFFELTSVMHCPSKFQMLPVTFETSRITLRRTCANRYGSVRSTDFANSNVTLIKKFAVPIVTFEILSDNPLGQFYAQPPFCALDEHCQKNACVCVTFL